jgi:hypothetical protein
MAPALRCGRRRLRWPNANVAQKMPGGDDANGFALNLLIMKAADETGQRLFAAGDAADLKMK